MSIAEKTRKWLAQSFFTMMSHRLYDWCLYRFVTQVLWRCPTERLLAQYVENLSDNHLEIGVGTGYFLERTLCADFSRRLVFMDLNRNCLKRAAERLKSLRPRLWRQDLLDPFQREGAYGGAGDDGLFSSAAMNYVLHCLPGGRAQQAQIFRRVASLLKSDGVLFGATLVEEEGGLSGLAKGLMRALNVSGIFNNANHTYGDLTEALGASFSSVEVCRVGCAVLFCASVPVRTCTERSPAIRDMHHSAPLTNRTR